MHPTTTHSVFTTSNLRRLLAAAALLALVAASAGATPSIDIGNGKEPVAALFIGDNLAAGLEGGEPYETYLLRLRDSDGTPIAEFIDTADAAGRVARRLFWFRTGVWGCDLGVAVNPALYQYQHFADAEDNLAGQTLVLEAFNGDAALVASRNLPILATLQEVAYFSSSAGCLRRQFRGDEHVYVSLRHPNRTAATRRLYLTPAGSLPIGATFSDVRGLATPPLWTLPATGNPVTVKVWDASQSTLGTFGGVFRWTGSAVDQVLSVDTVTEFLAYPPDSGGIVISVDGCPSCAVPP